MMRYSAQSGDDRDKEIVKERYISPENGKKLLMI